MVRSECAVASVRLGLSHPILIAQGAPSVGAGPARVEIPHEERLVLVHFPHDEVLDVGKWVGLVHIWEVFER